MLRPGSYIILHLSVLRNETPCFAKLGRAVTAPFTLTSRTALARILETLGVLYEGKKARSRGQSNDFGNLDTQMGRILCGDPMK